MSQRIIPYLIKNVNANTEYRETRKSDLDWILSECQRIVDWINQCESGEADLKSVAKELNKDNVLLPKMSSGKRNSVKSMCEGITSNFASGQYNLSRRTCEGITVAFHVVSELFDSFDEVKFELVQELPKLVGPPRPVLESQLDDVFDIDSIVVVYKRTNEE